ncbi:hypothetical protein [Stenotrophomonas maltophilia]|uniref:hypothetical protein n=1 Tax=Stenotrophomonas maltophilia TaxID=40324 RepID=UPI0015DE8B75|nr:hypothetical protein [Stenotrophomonas maltophilia]
MKIWVKMIGGISQIHCGARGLNFVLQNMLDKKEKYIRTKLYLLKIGGSNGRGSAIQAH